jgi:hydrogenase maturation protease
MSTLSPPRPVLVLGVGNLLLGDEGVGIHAVKAMAGMCLPDGVELLDGGTAGADLLDAISNRRQLIVVDALDADVEPGTVLRMGLDDLMAGPSGAISLHEFGIAETLMMARQLGCGPCQVAFIAIRPQDTRPGMELSPQMRHWMPGLINAILNEIAQH